jgi:uncharacterized protein YggE
MQNLLTCASLYLSHLVCVFYVNGSFESSASCSGNNNGNSDAVKLGGDGASTNYTNMKLASVQIYNRDLTSTEILQNYNTLKRRFGL